LVNALSQEHRSRDERWIMQVAVEIVKLKGHIKDAKGYRPVPIRPRLSTNSAWNHWKSSRNQHGH